MEIEKGRIVGAGTKELAASSATSPFFLENCTDKGWSNSAISFKIVGPCLISLSGDGDDLSTSLFEFPQLSQAALFIVRL